MTCIVYLKDTLGSVEVDEEFTAAINALNISSAKGNAFVIMDGMDGDHEAFNIPNILRIKETSG